MERVRVLPQITEQGRDGRAKANGGTVRVVILDQIRGGIVGRAVILTHDAMIHGVQEWAPTGVLRLRCEGCAVCWPTPQSGHAKGRIVELSIVSEETDGGVLVVAVAGELDVLSAPQLDDELTRAIASGSSPIVLDLAGVDFLDSTGLGVIIKAYKSAKDAARSFSVVASSERVVKVFRITGIDKALPLFDDLASALGG